MSQLLSEKVTPSLYPDLPPDEHLDLLLPKLTIRYWIGMGGCVIVVALLISWTLRDGSGSKQAKARNLAALAVGLLIAVYLYAHTVPPTILWLIPATTVYSNVTGKDNTFGRNPGAKQSIFRSGSA